MKKLILFFTIVVFAASCSSDKATVSIIVPNSPDSTQLIVNCLALNKVVAVDTIYTKAGKAIFSTNCTEGMPDFYYFYNNGEKIASAVVQKGDKITVTTDLTGNVSDVSGSDESILYQQVEKQMEEAYSQFESLSISLIKAQDDKNAKLEQSIKTDMGKLYVQSKQNAVKYIYKNPKSITVIPVLYQKISSELPIFAAETDVLFFKMAYDSLKTVYPHSPYILSLADDISKKESYLSFKNKVNNASVASFPDLSLYDQNAKVRNLSELKGQIIILSFWTMSEPNQKLFNMEMKSVYDKYHSKGVEVYQVSVDTDKTAWAQIIKDQNLQWISVCDPGNAAQSLNLYNLQRLPALFVFDKEGEIVGRDLFGKGELEKVIAKIAR